MRFSFLAELPPIALYAPYDRAECVARLRPLIARWWATTFSDTLVGFATERWLRLSLNNYQQFLVSWNNPRYRLVLRAKLSDEGVGTRISCRFGGPIPLRAIAIFVIMLPALPLATGPRLSPVDTLEEVLIVVAIVAIVLFGIDTISRSCIQDREDLIAILRQTLDAEDADWPAAGPLNRTTRS